MKGLGYLIILNKVYNIIMNFIKKSWSKLVLLSYAFFIPIISFAQNEQISPNNPCTAGKICNPIKTDTINDLIKTLLEGVLKVGIPIVALAIIYCGFLFVSAQGNTEKLTEAKKSLTYTLIGAAILLGSWAIAQLISNTVLAL